MSKTKTAGSQLKTLSDFYHRNGYVLVQNASRQKKEGRKYKKGDEVRLVALSMTELRQIRKLLADAGFKGGRPFKTVNRYRQPVYGREQVQRFLDLVGPRKKLAAPKAKKR